jgi:dTDP-4-amino-4,6-dideoxygalactose transaminase
MILKGPEDKNKYLSNHFFTNSARTAWRNVLRFFSIKKPFTILLPSYIGYTEREGSGVFDPVLETNTPYEFYPVTSDLAVQLEYLSERLSRGNVKILLVIHYFGFCPNDMNTIKILCNKHDVILVEDCAHAFTYGAKNLHLGYYGDFTFYSLHKFLPTETGGILMINSPQYLLPTIPKNEDCDYNVLLQILRSETDSIINKRRQNYSYLNSLLLDIAEIKILYQLKESTIPQSFPILIKKISREKLYFNLMQRGVPTIALYYRLISEIDKQQFPDSYEISDTILNLPIHQDTDRTDIDYLAKQLQLAIIDLKN